MKVEVLPDDLSFPDFAFFLLLGVHFIPRVLTVKRKICILLVFPNLTFRWTGVVDAARSFCRNFAFARGSLEASKPALVGSLPASSPSSLGRFHGSYNPTAYRSFETHHARICSWSVVRRPALPGSRALKPNSSCSNGCRLPTARRQQPVAPTLRALCHTIELP